MNSRAPKEDRPGWAYHLVTIGVALVAVVIVVLVAAGAGLLLSQSSQGAVPGRGVTPAPAPQWSPAPPR